MDYRFVVNVDVAAESLQEAYRFLYQGMMDLTATGPCPSWESSDEVYCDGEVVDPKDLQEAIESYLNHLRDPDMREVGSPRPKPKLQLLKLVGEMACIVGLEGNEDLYDTAVALWYLGMTRIETTHSVYMIREVK